ncbi:MAG: hypothetical protein ACYDGL_04815 [Bellilinea sp.]
MDTIAIGIVVLTSISLVWTEKWRMNVVAIALQYLVVFWFVSQSWPIGLASIKLIAGWVAGAVLGDAVSALNQQMVVNRVISARVFRAFAAIFIILLAFSAAPGAGAWIPVSTPALISGLILIGMGILQLGMTTNPMRVIVGLLTALSGFEILYAAVVSSVLVAGLLALVTLGLSLTGAYWLSLTPHEEQL